MVKRIDYYKNESQIAEPNIQSSGNSFPWLIIIGIILLTAILLFSAYTIYQQS